MGDSPIMFSDLGRLALVDYIHVALERVMQPAAEGECAPRVKGVEHARRHDQGDAIASPKT